MMAHVTYTSIMTLATVQGKLTDTAPQYVERIDGYIKDAQTKDIRITQCITDAKGDRCRPPSRQDDPDAYVHVVDRSPEGVVIRGAKLHITAASLGHDLMTIPTKSMKAGEEEYAIAAMVPVNERPRREDHQHDVRARATRTPATSRCRARPTRPRAS